HEGFQEAYPLLLAPSIGLSEKPIGEERRCILGVVVVKCFRCGSENPDGAVSCRNCGIALPTVPGPRPPGPRPEPILTAGERAILKAIGLIASFVVMVIGILLVGTSQITEITYYGWWTHWAEAKLEWGILLTMLGAILLVVGLVSIVVSRKVKGV
ncbi:MAG: zinc-ribbon domain-containing protein, partial [Thermoplasmata archaeon]